MTWKRLGLFGIGTPVVVLCLKRGFLWCYGRDPDAWQGRSSFMAETFPTSPFLGCAPLSPTVAVVRRHSTRPANRYIGGEGEDCRGLMRTIAIDPPFYVYDQLLVCCQLTYICTLTDFSRPSSPCLLCNLSLLFFSPFFAGWCKGTICIITTAWSGPI